MSCECEQYSVKCVRVNSCNVGTLIGITADETGTWTGVLEFNGAYKEFGINVEDGEEISILTSILNENYVHEFKLLDAANELVGCYKLHTLLTQGVSGAPVPPVASGAWDWAEATVTNSDVVTSVYLGGEIAPIIYQDSQSLDWEEQGIIWDNVTKTLTFQAAFTGKVAWMYRNLP